VRLQHLLRGRARLGCPGDHTHTCHVCIGTCIRRRIGFGTGGATTIAAPPERTAEAPRFSAVRFFRVRSSYGFKRPGGEHCTEGPRGRNDTSTPQSGYAGLLAACVDKAPARLRIRVS
ncbi:MAG: hypothetical protein ACR2OF_05375, partial [Hyphomicrobium sp.]